MLRYDLGMTDYMPCTTPINMTVTLDNRTAIALHPLDLTTPNSQSSCLGLIQSFPASSEVAHIADIILGVPFMRSTYTVMAYDVPSADGQFPPAAQSAGAIVNLLNPRLGLLGLTNATLALDEFHTVRVLNEPLSQVTGAQASTAGGGGGGGKKLSVGVDVLIGLVGFFALCVALFGGWMLQRRRMRMVQAADGAIAAAGRVGAEGKEGYMMRDVAYQLARRSSYGSRYGPSEGRTAPSGALLNWAGTRWVMTELAERARPRTPSKSHESGSSSTVLAAAESRRLSSEEVRT